VAALAVVAVLAVVTNISQAATNVSRETTKAAQTAIFATTPTQLQSACYAHLHNFIQAESLLSTGLTMVSPAILGEIKKSSY
jgi:hypothetical protein